jgi:crotonobetainyl-CoA:carnitine CoA-transferase CaiB-like acyl-CoA transferase
MTTEHPNGITRLAAEFGRHSSREVLAALEANDVPCSPINDVGEALAEKQVRAIGALRPFGEEGAAREYVVAPGTPSGSGARGLAPTCGADSASWLDRIGYSAEDIEKLRRAGAFGPA